MSSRCHVSPVPSPTMTPSTSSRSPVELTMHPALAVQLAVAAAAVVAVGAYRLILTQVEDRALASRLELS